MPPKKSSQNRKPPLTHRLLQRAHSPTTASSIHASKFVHKPLRLLATDPTSTSTSNATASNAQTATAATANTTDARTLRRTHRLTKAHTARNLARKKHKGRGPNSVAKPAPLTAAERRRLGVHDIPREERKQWDVYMGLHRLWLGYIREVLGVGARTGAGRKESYVVPQNAGAVLAGADFHGAMVRVVRSRCVERVGVEGVVVRDGKFAFGVITKRGELKTLPKEHTIFRFEVPLTADSGDDTANADAPAQDNNAKDAPKESDAEVKEQSPKSLVFELNGEQFKNRSAPDRARKQFKMHLPQDW